MNQTAVFGGGCFWCVEAVFNQLRGIISVTPGYAGGDMPDPTYERVCSGETGHAEVAKVEFDPSIITYRDLLTVFFAAHDPTQLNRQGNDVGAQYRSIILYTAPEQKEETEKYIQELGGGIVTEVRPLDKFYPAEDYHIRYFENHKDQMYCKLIIEPKIEKVRKNFKRLLLEKSL